MQVALQFFINFFRMMPVQQRRAFSLVEILTCIAIVIILGLLVFPWIKSMQESAQSAKCTGNLRQIGVAMSLYAGEHNAKYPPLPTSPDDYWSAYTIWNNPGNVRQWVCMGKLYEEGYLTDGRVFYCPTALKATFDYDSQWSKNVNGSNVTQGFRIGYLQRVADTEPVPGVISAVGGKTRILMTDNFRSTNYSQHRYALKSTEGQRWIHVLFSDGRVYADKSGNRWAHALKGSLYDDWEKHP